MSQELQNYKNHAKLVPGFHYVGSVLLLGLIIWSIARLAMRPSWGAASFLAVVISLNLIAFYARAFALGVQDRVIRLEERMRMERVLPDDLKARIMEVTTDQLIGLRFAPDEELADLTRRALDGELADRKAIKMAVKNWRPDYQRI